MDEVWAKALEREWAHKAQTDEVFDLNLVVLVSAQFVCNKGFCKCEVDHT
jgi:hypothetical protein